MGLVVSLGLERFRFALEQSSWETAMRNIVESGVTDIVRDVYYPDDPDAKLGIYEAYRDNDQVLGRYLPESEADEILQALAEAESNWGQISASFSWDQLEEMGSHDIQDLALRFDDRSRQMDVTQLQIAEDKSVRVISIERSQLNWGDTSDDDRVALKLHHLAHLYRLIVHSA